MRTLRPGPVWSRACSHSTPILLRPDSGDLAAGCTAVCGGLPGLTRGLPAMDAQAGSAL